MTTIVNISCLIHSPFSTLTLLCNVPYVLIIADFHNMLNMLNNGSLALQNKSKMASNNYWVKHLLVFLGDHDSSDNCYFQAESKPIT